MQLITLHCTGALALSPQCRPRPGGADIPGLHPGHTHSMSPVNTHIHVITTHTGVSERHVCEHVSHVCPAWPTPQLARQSLSLSSPRWLNSIANGKTATSELDLGRTGIFTHRPSRDRPSLCSPHRAPSGLTVLTEASLSSWEATPRSCQCETTYLCRRLHVDLTAREHRSPNGRVSGRGLSPT